MILLAAALLALANFVGRSPAIMSPDAIVQYGEALSGQYHDWHPPIMAFVWSLLPHVPDGPTPMMALHITCHWLGFALVADGMRKSGHSRTGWLILASGASPLFLYYSGIIYKDIGLASALISAFGLAFWFRIQSRPLPLIISVVALVLLFYAALVRANAIFAFPPILLYILVDPTRLSWKRLIPLSLALSVLAFPVSTFVNRGILKASNSGSAQALQFYDLVGIAHDSRDVSVLPSSAGLTLDEVDNCYTPLYWDPLAQDICGHAFQNIAPIKFSERSNINHLWLAAITTHPDSYAKHRAMHYNASINFFTPALQCRFAPFDTKCGEHDPRTGRMIDTPAGQALIKWDYIKKNPLVWPVTWLVFAVSLIAMTWSSLETPGGRAARALVCSAVIYSLGYAIVGVASDIRYYYWPIMAIQTAIIVMALPLRRAVKERRQVTAICSLLLLFVIGAAYFARVTDNRMLVNQGPAAANV